MTATARAIVICFEIVRLMTRKIGIILEKICNTYARARTSFCFDTICSPFDLFIKFMMDITKVHMEKRILAAKKGDCPFSDSSKPGDHAKTPENKLGEG